MEIVLMEPKIRNGTFSVENTIPAVSRNLRFAPKLSLTDLQDEAFNLSFSCEIWNGLEWELLFGFTYKGGIHRTKNGATQQGPSVCPVGYDFSGKSTRISLGINKPVLIGVSAYTEQ